MKQLLSEVIEAIKPDEKYQKEILGKANDIIRKINKNLRDAKAILGGSGAKETWLKTFDADIFVKFNYPKYEDKSDELSGVMEKALKKIYPKIARLHGSRDYFQIKDGKFTFEIIPILDIRKAEEAKNITDVSPLHSKFVLKHKKMADEIRLTKQFCKANNIYGAESYMRGFSGYICEILTIHYGSFLSLVKNAAKWKDKVVIDIKKYYKARDIFKEMNKSKLASPLVVIDPVQKDRNAAAALSMEKFYLFKKKSTEFIKSPSKEFFEIREFNISILKEKFRKEKLILLEVFPLKRKEDISGAKLLKAFEFLKKELGKNDFGIIESNWHWDKKAAYFYFAFENRLLPETKEIAGPPVRIKFHYDKFMKKHKKTMVRGNRVFAIAKRNFRDSEKLIRVLISGNYLKNYVKKIKIA